MTLPSCMGSSQKVMKSIISFNTRAVQVLRHIDKSSLKTLRFSNNQSLSKCFSRALLRFYSISCDFSELQTNEIRSANTNGEFRVPADMKDGVLCPDSYQYWKEPHLRCARSFWLYNSLHLLLVTVQMEFPGDRKFLTRELFLLFLLLLIRKKAHGADKNNKI